MLKSPEPVILQTIFTSEFACGGIPVVDISRAQSCTFVAVPCASGPTDELSIGDAGWQSLRPGVVGPVTSPVIAGDGTRVGFCTADDVDVDEPVEHAASSRTDNKRQTGQHPITRFLLDCILNTSLIDGYKKIAACSRHYLSTFLYHYEYLPFA